MAKVYNRAQFYKAMRMIFDVDHVAFVQEFVTGHDDRIVVLDGKIISAYERVPLLIMSDGKLSVQELLEKNNAHSIEANVTQKLTSTIRALRRN